MKPRISTLLGDDDDSRPPQPRIHDKSNFDTNNSSLSHHDRLHHGKFPGVRNLTTNGPAHTTPDYSVPSISSWIDNNNTAPTSVIATNVRCDLCGVDGHGAANCLTHSGPVLAAPENIPTRRPYLVHSHEVTDSGRPRKAPRLSDLLGAGTGSNAEHDATQTHLKKSGAPIAEVLNNSENQPSWQERMVRVSSGHLPGDEVPATSTTLPSPIAPPADAASGTGTAPTFSGRLSDILIDPLRDHGASKSVGMRSVLSWSDPTPGASGTTTAETNNANSNASNNLQLTLPQLPPKKPARRPRIPPLLQGLHQPPPLPEGRLFPPITGESHGFGLRSDKGESTGLKGLGRGTRDTGKSMDEEFSTSTSLAVENPSERPRTTDQSVPAPPSNRRGVQAITDLDHASTKQKRNKWTEEETKELLLGVAKFGVGNWKSILNCPEFQFDQRTTTDLKDRFRTVRPGGKSRAKLSTKLDDIQQNEGIPFRGGAPEEVPGSESTAIGKTSIATSTRQRKPRSDKQSKNAEELAEMGIQGPLNNSSRRERRLFTEKDDENLLKGFDKYGCEWVRLRNDKELGFTTRRPTDLRDRFRTRYPEKYREAGKVLKVKETRAKEADNGLETVPDEKPDDTPTHAEDTTVDTAIMSGPLPEHSGLRPHTLLTSLDPLLGPSEHFDGFDDFVPEEEAENRSPITLNNNILHWKGTVSSSTMPSTATTASIGSRNHISQTGEVARGPLSQDVESMRVHDQTRRFPTSFRAESSHHKPHSASRSLHGYAGSQGTNDNTQASAHRNINNTMHWTEKPASNGFDSSRSHALISGLSLVPPTTNSSQPTTSAVPTPAPSLSSSARNLRRSSNSNNNLPGLVFPQVPISSARNATHNLPHPADLLSSDYGDATHTSVPDASHANGGILDPTNHPRPRLHYNGESTSIPQASPGVYQTPSAGYPHPYHVAPPSYPGTGYYPSLAYNSITPYPPGVGIGMPSRRPPTSIETNMESQWTGTLAPLHNNHMDMGMPLAAPPAAPSNNYSGYSRSAEGMGFGSQNFSLDSQRLQDLERQKEKDGAGKV